MKDKTDVSSGDKISPVKEWPYQRFHNWVMKLLRRGSATFPNRELAYKAAYAGKMRNEATGRMAMHYTCAICTDVFPKYRVEADHIEPVVPVTGWVSWDDTINRLFVPVEGYQILCKDCHAIKSGLENKQRPRRKKKVVPRLRPTRLRKKKQ